MTRWVVEDKHGQRHEAGETRKDAEEYAALWDRDTPDDAPHRVVGDFDVDWASKRAADAAGALRPSSREPLMVETPTLLSQLLYPFTLPMRELLETLSNRLVVVGSVARTIRSPDYERPKDLDLLCDLDSDEGRAEIASAIKRLGLRYESPFLACWTFRDDGWMVEILGIHHGPPYKTVRRRAEKMDVDGVDLWVAQPADAPTERASRS